MSEAPKIETPWDFEGWQQIALALGRDVRTIQKWSRHEDDPLPVHSDPVVGVVATKAEIEAWLRRRVT